MATFPDFPEQLLQRSQAFDDAAEDSAPEVDNGTTSGAKQGEPPIAEAPDVAAPSSSRGKKKGLHRAVGKDQSDNQVSSMKEAFTLFDTDGDGRIVPSELGILMRSLGGNPTQAQLKSIIAEENLLASFDFPRFLDLMAKHTKPEPFDRQLHDAFKVLDKDATGFVFVAELRHILTRIGEKLEPAEFNEWIREVDVNYDGK
ncbi:probable calcium-binding protein CML13, partial [Morus notabilis]|uniref:probable calcium-binding protein CML13 n=1 Tax=Morus notabilis TaxID=981085 RepID=UPI000CED3C82